MVTATAGQPRRPRPTNLGPQPPAPGNGLNGLSDPNNLGSTSTSTLASTPTPISTPTPTLTPVSAPCCDSRRSARSRTAGHPGKEVGLTEDRGRTARLRYKGPSRHGSVLDWSSPPRATEEP
ncbi:hypothetical protein [Streptomyces sp. x-80]|uniref:hypothetical protein n=1 Tax=Streptomyces sp. x-80 TaxID=2789282 RepID=UPI003980984A